MTFQLCRLCLISSKNAIDIFGLNEQGSNIAKVLGQHFWFELSPEDAISTFICSVCWTQVSDFHNFYISVEEAQKCFEMKPIFKEELPQTWHEEVLLPTELLTVETKNTENPLEEQELLQNNIKVEQQTACDISEDNNQTDIETKSSIDDRTEDDDGDYENDVIIQKTRRRIKKIKKIAPKSPKVKNISEESKTPRRQKFPPFCKEDEELIKKYIPMACELCIFLAENFEGIREHFKDAHIGVKPFVKCCGRKLGKRCLLVEHARRHENPEYIKCEDCGKCFANSSVLRAHWLANHVPDEECKFKCDQCEKKFSRAHFLHLHKASHVPQKERKFVCNICPKHNAFASEYHLQIHTSMQHRRAPNICHVCGKEIRDKAVFAKHVRLHFEDSGPRVKCPRPNCDRWLKDEDNLKAHLRRHNDEGLEFICNQCGKNCKNKRALVSHIRYSHTNVIYTCEQCNKTFKKDISLKEHMAQHTGEPLYKCPFCPRTFNSNANMHSHKKKMHPVEWDVWRKTKRGSAQAILPSAQIAQVFREQLDKPIMSQ